MKEFSADMLNAGGKPFGELIRDAVDETGRRILLQSGKDMHQPPS